jgi:hypothetical protein
VFVGLSQVAQGPNSTLRFYEITNLSEAVGFFALPWSGQPSAGSGCTSFDHSKPFTSLWGYWAAPALVSDLQPA